MAAMPMRRAGDVTMSAAKVSQTAAPSGLTITHATKAAVARRRVY
jgi:hypothetical protein